MGVPVLKNWNPVKIVSFLKENDFYEIKKKKRSRGDHICLFNRKTGRYTEIDMGRKSYSAREMLTISKQTGLSREEWLKDK